MRPSGLSAGRFQRLYRRLPGGATTVRVEMDNVTTTLSVVSSSGFPRNAPFLVRVTNPPGTLAEMMLVTNTNNSNNWTVTRNQRWGYNTPPIGLRQPDVGWNVVQAYGCQLTADVNSTTTTFPVDRRDLIPQYGPFLMQWAGVDPATGLNNVQYDETVSVISGFGQTPAAGNLTVIRNTRGWQGPHFNTYVGVAVPQGIYDIADFNQLFLSGLITG
jgi:hypothetical protein